MLVRFQRCPYVKRILWDDTWSNMARRPHLNLWSEFMSPSEALNIVLDLAIGNALNPEHHKDDPDLCKEAKKQQEAIDVVVDKVLILIE
jgi:hypothetical protein